MENVSQYHLCNPNFLIKTLYFKSLSHKSKSISWNGRDGENEEEVSTAVYCIQALRIQRFYISDIETAGKGTLPTRYTIVVLGEVRADFKTHHIM